MSCDCTRHQCNCIIESSDPTCLSVSGEGTDTNPYMVGVEISPSAGNTLQCLQSGLFASPGEVTVEDTDCIDMEISGAGDTADPYVVSANPILSGDPQQLLSCEADGLLAHISDDANNQALIGTDGGVFVAPATVDGSAGCGIDINGGIISVDALTEADWPFACDIANGQRIYCADNGVLRIAPDHYPVAEFVGPAESIPAGTVIAANGGMVCSPQPTVATIDNSAGCRDVVVHLQFGLSGDWTGEPGAQIGIQYNRVLDGVPAGPILVRTMPRHEGLTPSQMSEDMERDFIPITVPAGAVFPVEGEICLVNNGTADATILTGSQLSVRYVGGTS